MNSANLWLITLYNLENDLMEYQRSVLSGGFFNRYLVKNEPSEQATNYYFGDPDAAPQVSLSWPEIGFIEFESKYKRFLPIAQAFAQMSKLPGTKVGCVILGEGKEVLSTGWNGAPRGCDADTDKRSVEREERLDWTVHAEANAIANAARSGTKLMGGTLICTLMPCMACAKSIVQAGIVRVVCPKPGVENARWGKDFKLAKELFSECGVVLEYIDTNEEKA